MSELGFLRGVFLVTVILTLVEIVTANNPVSVAILAGWGGYWDWRYRTTLKKAMAKEKDDGKTGT